MYGEADKTYFKFCKVGIGKSWDYLLCYVADVWSKISDTFEYNYTFFLVLDGLGDAKGSVAL